MSVLHDPKLEGLLAGLHARSDEQLTALRTYDAERVNEAQPTAADEAARLKAFRSDKLVALDRDKAEFCYQLCRAGNARRIVEIGTSYGVSTLYLAAAVRDNIAASGGEGVVIGTEYEPEKARAARAHFEEAGLSRFIELREGDLRQTLQEDRRAGRFRADGYLDRHGAAGARAGGAASQARRHRRLRQHRAVSQRLCRLFRLPRRARQRLPHHDPAVRRRPGTVGALPALMPEFGRGYDPRRLQRGFS